VCMYLCVSLCESLCLILWLCIWVNVSLCFQSSLSLCMSMSLSLPMCLSPCCLLPLYVCVCMYLCVSLCWPRQENHKVLARQTIARLRLKSPLLRLFYCMIIIKCWPWDQSSLCVEKTDLMFVVTWTGFECPVLTGMCVVSWWASGSRLLNLLGNGKWVGGSQCDSKLWSMAAEK